MISNVKYLSFILLLVLTACKSGPAASQEQNGKQDTVKVFNLPDIPVVLNTVSQRADYMVKHYWDRFDFTDTTYVSQIDVAEQAWVDYCDLLEHVPLSDAQTAIKETIGRAGKTKRCWTSLRNWPINISTTLTRLCVTRSFTSPCWKL